MQADAAPSTVPSASGAPSAAVEPGPTVVIERPPPGLAQGRYPVPAWAVIGLATALVLGTVAFFVARQRRRRPKAEDSLGPASIPPSSRQTGRRVS